MIVVEQLKLMAGHTKDDLCARVCKKLGIKDLGKCPEFRIIKRSLDARKKPDIFFVYSVEITEPGFIIPKRADKKHVRSVKKDVPPDISRLRPGADVKRPVVVGFGPAGMFCALMLARAGLKPVVLERGRPAGDRIRDVEKFFSSGMLDPDSNVQFGEGGAGTFSDGKLNTGTGDQGGRAREVLLTFVKHGAPEEILYDNKPHIGTDILVNVIMGIRNEILDLGGEILFESCFEELITDKSGGVCGCRYRSGSGHLHKETEAGAVCLAIGHSARDTFEALYKKNIPMEQKAFAVGLRIEHPQEIIDRYVYGDDHRRLRDELGLPAGDYKLTAHTPEGRGVYSFCMCPGGFVVNSSSETGMTAVNGMSFHARDGVNANSALIVTVSGKDFGEGVLAGVEFQRQLERAAFKEGGGDVPVQLLGDFKENRKSRGTGRVEPCIKGRWRFGNLRNVLPAHISDAINGSMEYFDKKIPGFNMSDACLSGVESRTSSPVRIMRGNGGMSEVRGLFPCGEGAGYAGGIMSAAVDGIKCAENMAGYMSSHSPVWASCIRA